MLRVHNGAVRTTTPTRRLAGLLTTALVAGVALAGCGGDSEKKSSDQPSASGSATDASTGASTPNPVAPGSSGQPSYGPPASEAYLDVPDGVTLTEPGSEFGLETIAFAAWNPKQDQVGVVGLQVQKIQKTTFKESFVGWDVSKSGDTVPYFVSYRVANLGETDLGGRSLPVYALDSSGTLNEGTTFGANFEPCPSGPLPKVFAPGKRANLCQVFLVPSDLDLSGVTFRFNEDLQLAPLTWTGAATPLKDPSKKDKQGDKKNKNGKGTKGKRNGQKSGSQEG